MFSRSAFLKLAGAAGLAAGLQACKRKQPTPQAQEQGAETPLAPLPTASPPATGAPVAAAPTAFPSATPPEPVTLQYWDLGGSQGEWFAQEIKLFQNAYPWVNIVRSPQKEMSQALNVAFAGGRLPDCYLEGPALAAQQAAKKFFCRPLSVYADFEDFKNSFPRPALDFVPLSNQFDGKTYSAPREARSGWSNQLFINLDVLRAARLDPERLPSTDSELIETARAVFKNSRGSVYGYANGFATVWMNALFEWQGARSYKVGGYDWRSGKSSYSSNPTFQKMLEMMATLAKEGLVLPEARSGDEATLRASFAEGKVAIIHGGMWNVNDWKQSHPNFTNYTILPPLLLGEEAEFTYYTPPGLTGTPIFIGAHSKHPEEAWLWFKWLHHRNAGERWVKSGSGFSIFPQNNRADFFTDLAWKDYTRLFAGLSHVEPQPGIRNPDCSKVKAKRAEPDFAALGWEVFSGALPRGGIASALEKLAATADANWQTALTKAQKDGAKIEAGDFIFSDWQPLEDYVTMTA